MLEKWGLIIAWDIPNNCYVASVPELLACTSVGQTRREALDALEQEVEHWLETSRELDYSRSTRETQDVEDLPIKNPQTVNSTWVEPRVELPVSRRAANKPAKSRLDLLAPLYNKGITITVARDLPIIFLKGEANRHNCSILSEACDNFLDSGKHIFAIDMTGLSSLDSSTLAAMLTALKKARSANGSICLIKSKEHNVNRLFEVMRFDTIFQMCDSLNEAIEKLNTMLAIPI